MIDESRQRYSTPDDPPENRIADYAKSIPLEDARHNIETSFPDLHIASITPFAKGLGNDLFLVNGEDVFRFPKNEKASASLTREAALLPALESHLALSIPHLRWVKRTEHGTAAFVGYPMLPGRNPEQEDVYDPGGVPDAGIAQQLGQFFTNLHGFDQGQARSLGVIDRDYREFYARQLEDFRATLFPMLRERLPQNAEVLISRLENVFTSHFTDEANFAFKPRLLHGDLETDNMLIDPDTKKVTAVIDWGGAHLGDPDFDLWRPYFHFGKAFMDEVLKTYAHPDPDHLYRKMEFFMTTQICFRLMRAVFVEGVESEKAQGRLSWKERLMGKEV